MSDIRQVLTEAAATPTNSDVDIDDLRRRVRRRRAQRRGAAASGIAMVTVLAISFGVIAVLDQRAQVEFFEQPPDAPDDPVAHLPVAPLTPRFSSFAAWSGDEFLVWGGYASGGTENEGPAADGAAFNPRTDQWRQLALAPLVGAYGGVSAWTGQEWVIVGGYGGPDGRTTTRAAAAYDPAADAWRQLPDVPVAVTAGTWTPNDLIVVGFGAGDDRAIETWRLQDDEDAWMPVGPRLPYAPEQALAASPDGGVFLVTPTTAYALEAATANAIWSPLPPPPMNGAGDGLLAAWAGEGLLVLTSGQSLLYEPDARLQDGQWRTAPAVPLERFGLTLQPLPAGPVVAMSDASPDTAIFDLADLEWRRGPTLPITPRQWAALAASEKQLFVWGGAGPNNQPLGDGVQVSLSTFTASRDPSSSQDAQQVEWAEAAFAVPSSWVVADAAPCAPNTPEVIRTGAREFSECSLEQLPFPAIVAQRART